MSLFAKSNPGSEFPRIASPVTSEVIEHQSQEVVPETPERSPEQSPEQTIDQSIATAAADVVVEPISIVASNDVATTMPLRLLIIDDDADQRAITCEVLEDHFGKGTIKQAGTGAEALAYDLSDFDLIISDYNLPDTTGLKLLEKIRQSCKTPVIMVTGENDSEIAAEAIRKGATDYVVKMGEYFFTLPLVVQKNLTVVKLMRENDMLRSNLEAALSEVQQTNSQLESSLKRVEEMAATDPLTGLYNRRHFSKVLEQMYDEAARYGNDLAIMMVDLDGYKQLNDSLGHQVGDQILVLVGRILRESMRKADVAARYGGDEFVLLLPQCDSVEAQNLAVRIRDVYRQETKQMLKREKGMSMSIGIASISANHAVSGDELVSRADAALYVSKENGRDRVTMSTAGKRMAAV
jgi:two-component system, cell cycle response regulator